MSIKVNVYNQNGDNVEEISLSKKVFLLEANNDLIHQSVVAQMANQRQVLAHTKERVDVRGGGKKPWKQKGTGRARAGTSRSPIWRGGGVTFGPLKVNNFKKKINKKMKHNALLMVLSDKISSNCLIVLDKIDVKEVKTKNIDLILKNLETKILNHKEAKKRSILLINDENSQDIKRVSKNLIGVHSIGLNNINIVDLLKYSNVIMTREVIEKIDKQYK